MIENCFLGELFDFRPVFRPSILLAVLWDSETQVIPIKKDAFQRPWINWLIRLI